MQIKGLVCILLLLGITGISYYYSDKETIIEGTLREQCMSLNLNENQSVNVNANINQKSVQIQSNHLCVTCINMTLFLQKLVYKQAKLQFQASQSTQSQSQYQLFKLLKVDSLLLKQKNYDLRCQQYLQLIKYDDKSQANSKASLPVQQNKHRQLIQFDEGISSITNIVKDLNLQLLKPRLNQKLVNDFAIVYRIKSSLSSNMGLRLFYINKSVLQIFANLYPLSIIFIVYALLKFLVECMKRNKQKQVIQLYLIAIIIEALLFWNIWHNTSHTCLIQITLLLAMSYLKLQASHRLILITIVTFILSQFLPGYFNLVSWAIFPFQIIYRFRHTHRKQSFQLIVISFILLAAIKILLDYFVVEYLVFGELSQLLIVMTCPILLMVISQKPMEQFKQFEQNKGISLKGYENQMQEMYED